MTSSRVLFSETQEFNNLPVDEQLNGLWEQAEKWCHDQRCYGPVKTNFLAWEKLETNWRLCVVGNTGDVLRPVLHSPMKDRIKLADCWDDFKAEFERVATEFKRDAAIAVKHLKRGL